MASTTPRPPCVHHCTSEPYRFFGREAELTLLDDGFAGGVASVVALVGPGGQGKTAILQHWLRPFVSGERRADGVFLWSFYRGQDAGLCLRSLYGYAEGTARPPDVSATWCVDHLLPVLRRERWALVLDGTEVAQHDQGPWFGRFMHPELGRLLEELASAPLPGVVLLTSRFPLPELERRRHARVLSLGGLDPASARGLLRSVGANGTDADLDDAAEACGDHAKAVELLGTYVRRFLGGDVRRQRELPAAAARDGFSSEEEKVLRVLSAFQAALSAEAQDVLALATAFREPPTEARLLEYLSSGPVQTLLHDTWRRDYTPFPDRAAGWLSAQVQELIDLRLLERVGTDETVVDAHPLVRRGFDFVLGSGGRRESAQARAGFLRGRPDRRRPASLEDAREEVELFHAYCDAGLWNEADSTFIALDNPKHRFLAPAFERDLLLRFFPGGDWRRPPLWPGFGRYRALAISLEMLGSFEDAIAAYREADAPLRGDALIALGRLGPLLDRPRAPAPWETLWQAYRAHALCLAGRTDEAVTLARSLVPVDVYEWIHVFECLLRAGLLDAIDLRSVLYRPPGAAEERWRELGRCRMQADHRRVTEGAADDLDPLYLSLIEEYDRAGLPWERCLTRLGHARWLSARGLTGDARAACAVVRDVSRRHGMRIMEADAAGLLNEAAARPEEYRGPIRP
jgi:hypothetical protein